MTTGSTETFDLLQRFKEGDRYALDRLLRRDLDWLRGYVHRQLGDGLRRVGDTGDFVQEAAIHVLEYGPRFVLSSRDQFRALLARIVVNVLRSRHRHLHALKRTPERERAAAGGVLWLDAPVDPVTRPDEVAERNEERERLRLALLLLDPQDQEVLELHMAGGTDGSIAGELGIRENAARMRRQRATGRLARLALRLKQGDVTSALEEARSADGEPASED